MAFVVIVFIYKITINREVKYVRSDIDGKEYLVRDLDDKQQASNMLARINKNIMDFTDHLVLTKDKHPEFEQYIDQLDRRIRDVVISESKVDSSYTSYSVNKGEELVFCLRDRRTNKIHRMNLIMYVVLHEISHVACPVYGHGPLFKKIFRFFTQVAIDKGFYRKIDFNRNPELYCGLMISESII